MSTASPVKSAMRTLDVIEFVVASGRAVAAQEIASVLDIPVSSLSYLLATLVERQYLERDGRFYRPGIGLERLRRPDDSIPVAERIAPFVRAIRKELNETTSFMVRQGWDAEAVVTEASGQALRYAIDAGERRPLHALAAGKALLATLTPEELDRYFIESVRERYTDATIVGEIPLRKAIEEIRSSGIAEAHEESTPGISSIASPVAVAGKYVGAIGIALPTIRCTEDLRVSAIAQLREASARMAAV